MAKRVQYFFYSIHETKPSRLLKHCSLVFFVINLFFFTFVCGQWIFILFAYTLYSRWCCFFRHIGHTECSGFRVSCKYMKCCTTQKIVPRSALTPVKCLENFVYLPLNLHASASKGNKNLLALQNLSKSTTFILFFFLYLFIFHRKKENKFVWKCCLLNNKRKQCKLRNKIFQTNFFFKKRIFWSKIM